MTEFYSILAPEAEVRGLAATLDRLYTLLQNLFCQKNVRPNHIVVAKFFLSDAMNQWPLVQQHPLFDELQRGVVTYIEQPPLDGSKVQLWLHIIPETTLVSEKLDAQTIRYGLADSAIRHTFQSVRLTSEEAQGKDGYEQTMLAFNHHNDYLHTQGLTLKDNCIRTWIYVRDIDTHYMSAVAARNDLFDKEGLTKDTHFIASTGIGGITATREAIVAIDFYSVSNINPESQVTYLHALEYLNPTHEYGVAFERATRVTYDNYAHYLVSGTASIDKCGDCVHRDDIVLQTERMMINIEQLLANGEARMEDINYFYIYLRDIADYKWVSTYFNTHYPNTPYIICEARVCRPEWLIETEVVATRPL